MGVRKFLPARTGLIALASAEVNNQAQTWNKWQRWLEEIEQEILDLHHSHEIWRTLVDLIAAQELSESEYFVEAFTRMYVAGQAMGVRRQADTDQGTVSLARLLTGLSNQSGVVTQERFFALWGLNGVAPDTERDELERRARTKKATRAWAQFAGPLMGPVLDPAVPRGDLQGLHETAAAVTRYADKTIAHRDLKGPKSLPTFQQLHAAIDVLGQLYCRYSLLLTASAPNPASLAPKMQGDWLAPFRRPLL